MVSIFLGIFLTLAVIAPARAQIPIIYLDQQLVPRPDVGEYENIRSVAVISAIGQNLVVAKPNFWDIDTADVDISQWNLDAQLLTAMKGYVEGRFEVVDVPYDPLVLSSLENGVLISTTQQMQDFLRTLPAEGVDAFIVIRPSQRYDTPGVDQGLSLETRQSGTVVLWANYDIEIVDGRTYEVIADSYSRLTTREGEEVGFAGVYGSTNLLFEDGLVPSETQMEEMEVRFTRLVSMSLVETLRSLELGLDLPTAGERNIIDLPPDFRPFPGVERIAVVSAIGDEFRTAHLATIFNSGEAQISSLDWNIDAGMEQAVRDTLAGRYAFADAGIDRNALFSLRVTDEEGNPRETISELPASTDFDAYLLITKYRSVLEDDLLTPRFGEGIGIWRMGRLQLYAQFHLSLIDAETLEPLFIIVGTASPAYAERTRHYLDDALVADDVEDFTPERVSALQAELAPFLRDMVEETLLRMRMTGKTFVGGFTGEPDAPEVSTETP